MSTGGSSTFLALLYPVSHSPVIPNLSTPFCRPQLDFFPHFRSTHSVIVYIPSHLNLEPESLEVEVGIDRRRIDPKITPSLLSIYGCVDTNFYLNV